MTCALALVRWSKQDSSCDSNYLNVTANAAPDPSADLWLGNPQHSVLCGCVHAAACTCLPACGKLAVATWALSGKDAMVILCLVQHLAPSVLLSPLLPQSHLSFLTFCLSAAFFLLRRHSQCFFSTVWILLYQSKNDFFLISELFTDRLKARCCWKVLVILPTRSARQSKAAQVRLIQKMW